MDTRIKQRIVGGVIIISIIVICLPWLLDGAARQGIQVQTRIPEPLEVESIKEQVEINRGITEQIETQIEDDHSTVKELPAEEFSADDRMLVKPAWTLQVGSFSSGERANGLKQRLLDAKYRAYTRKSVDEDGAVLIRVFVGPDLRREDTENTASQLASDENFALNGLILTYKP